MNGLDYFDKAFKEIKPNLKKFKSDFTIKYKEHYIEMKNGIYNEEELESQIELLNILMFGKSISGSYITTKVDFNKNKNLLKSLIINPANFKETINIINFISISIDNFLYVTIAEPIKDLSCIIDGLNETTESLKNTTSRLVDMIDSFSYESTSVRSQLSSLNYIYSGMKKGENEGLIPSKITTDVLKRYYFTHVYQLKNNVKIFEPSMMLYGEINNIMRIFDKVCDFCFGDFIYFYQTIRTILNDTDF